MVVVVVVVAAVASVAASAAAAAALAVVVKKTVRANVVAVLSTISMNTVTKHPQSGHIYP